MDIKRQRKILFNAICVVLIFMAILFGALALRLYLENIDRKVELLSESTDIVYTSKSHEMDTEGLYKANIEKEVVEYIGNRNASSVTYKIDGEPFYFILGIVKDENNNITVTLEKIVNPELGINARVNIRELDSINYRTDNNSNAVLLKINTINTGDYFAMIENKYYSLGSDIETISYKNDQFYYLSYNPDYTFLEDAQSCDKEVKNMFDGFNLNDYYYKYGEINFLDDYYQKLASKVYTVGDKCSEFETKESEDK